MADPTEEFTSEEQHNLELVKEYMHIAYDPQRASADAVKHLCAPDNEFIAPTTFPDVHSLEEYAEDHGKLMRQVNDLHFVSFDVLFAKGTGSRCATPPKEATVGSPMAISPPPARRPGGQPAPCFASGTASLSSSSRTGTSCRCGNSSAGLSKSA